MREESHLDEMRDAIRGDFERLADRRGEQDLMRVTELEASVVDEPAMEPAPAPEAELDPEPEPGRAEHKSWLARLFSA